ncbi:MAG: chloride channel protein [Bacteroidales bacterium]|nr:chloride channel protein [Bacteroidales bacterium]
MKKQSLIGRFNIWRNKHVDEQYFLIIISAVIGLSSGLAAYILKSGVYFIEELLTARFHMESQNYLYVIYPLIGIILSVFLVKYLLNDRTRQGIPRILFVISRLDGKMRIHKFFSSIFGSTLTAGFGGSIGLESPIIASGSSIGSGIGQLFKLNYKTRTLLIGCGAAGAMASIFTTPVAAVIFSLEVLMLDLTTASIIPLSIASVTGAITTKLLLAERFLFNFSVSEGFEVSDIPFFFILGILSGLISLYFNVTHYWLANLMDRYHYYINKTLLGGLLLGLIIFIFPPLFGEGYEMIRMIVSGHSEDLLNNSFFYKMKDNSWMVLVVIGMIMLLKVIATTLTTEAGGIGGIFAPAAIMGGLSGFIFSNAYNQLGWEKQLSETNFTLVGMAAVLGGVLHAPLTAIFLIAEMNSGYALFVPLMLSTSISFLTVKAIDPHSIFTRELAQRGDLITHHKDKTVLTLLKLNNLIDKDLQTISPDSSLGDLTKIIAKSKRNIFPVVEDDNKYIGLVVMDDVREDMFNQELYDRPISEYIIQSPEEISPHESMQTVLDKFNRTGNYNLPVIFKGKYIGFVSRANIFNAYRKTLQEVSDE